MENKPNKKGYIQTIIGNMGEGKTPEIINKYVPFMGKPLLVYDIHNEYSHIKNAECVSDRDTFMKRMYEVRDRYIICDEGDTIFNGYTVPQLMEFIFAIQHNRCVFIGAFHSVKDTPEKIIAYSKYIIWFNTGDGYNTVKERDKRLLRYYYVKKPVIIYTRDESQWSEKLPILK